MNLPVLAKSRICEAVAAYAGPFALFERVNTAASPFEVTATPDASPRFKSGGSLREFGVESNGISATLCCATITGARTAAALTNTAHARTRYLMVPPSRCQIER